MQSSGNYYLGDQFLTYKGLQFENGADFITWLHNQLVILFFPRLILFSRNDAYSTTIVKVLEDGTVGCIQEMC